MSSLKKLINPQKPSLTFKKLWLRYRLAARHIKDSQWEWVYFGFAFSVPMTCGLTYFFFNTIGLKHYKNYVRLYVNDEEVPLTQRLEMLALEVWNKAKIPRKCKLLDFADFFLVSGCETFGAGSLETRSGAIFGLPFNWTYDDVTDIRHNEIQFVGENNESIDWQSELGTQLLESLVLSTDAQKFGIAREIHLANTFRVQLNGMSILCGLMAGFVIGHWAVHRYRVPRSLPLRLVVRAVALCAGVLVAKIVNDVLDHEWQLNADKCAINEGPEFLDGAVEYYEKMRARNASLHHLLGEIGKQKYTADGELRNKYGLPAASITISDRLAKIEKNAKEQREKEIKNKA